MNFKQFIHTLIGMWIYFSSIITLWVICNLINNRVIVHNQVFPISISFLVVNLILIVGVLYSCVAINKDGN